MVRDPDKWPLWPTLPMKRHGETGFFVNTSVSYNTVKFYIGNMYDRKNAVEQNITDVEAVLDAGWRVD